MAGNELEHEDMFDPAMVEELGMMFDDEVPAYSCVKVVWCAWPPPSCHGDSRVCCLLHNLDHTCLITGVIKGLYPYQLALRMITSSLPPLLPYQ